MNKTGDNNKNKKQLAKPNPLEALKQDVGATAKQMRQEASEISRSFTDHVFGRRSFQGEIVPGEALEMSKVYSGEHKETQKLRKQVRLERRLIEEERIRVEKKSNELKLQLKVLQEEIITLADKTEDLAEETKVAAMQAPAEPGVYHVIFFEKLLEFIKSFRKKIEEARVWLHAVNKRAQKKNVWGQRYKKHGAKYLLSGEHYLTRSAG
jgi:uncharacterized FlgJ-related protein